MELLLLSNSRSGGGPFLAHVAGAVEELLGGRRLLFVPYADADHAEYTDTVTRHLAALGVEVTPLHSAPDPVAAVRTAEAMFLGGGNTFRLLHALQARGLVDPIRAAASGGVPYLGSSAGACLACPSLRTVTDMPVVEPDGLGALGLVPFQIVPHYTADRTTVRQIAGFHRHNDVPVLGIGDGAHVRVSGGTAVVAGTGAAALFLPGRPPERLGSGADLTHLLRQTTNSPTAKTP